MSEIPPHREVVFADRSRSTCDAAHLVLTAVGIEAKVLRRENRWVLLVDRRNYEQAARELAEYEQENAEAADAAGRAEATYSYVGAGIVAYGAVLLVVAALVRLHSFDVDWLDAGRMQAGRVLGGEWWRAATALTLHRDAAHLAGNLVFGALFGWMVGETFGGGVGWLTILLAGAMGNGVNAALQEGGHNSIGASTAVYAALGIVVARYIRPRTTAGESPLKRYRPLIGGVVLLTFTGISGERTDVMAHVAGFATGMIAGATAGLIPPRRLASQTFQQSAGWTCLGLILAAWTLALT